MKIGGKQKKGKRGSEGLKKKRWEGRVIKVGQREETFIQLDSPLYPSSMKYFLHSTLLDL